MNHTYFNIAVGQISHFGRVSLLHNTDLGEGSTITVTYMCILTNGHAGGYNDKIIQREKRQTLIEVPQPTMRVVLSFQHKLQGYMSGLRSALSRSTVVIRCLVLMS